MKWVNIERHWRKTLRKKSPYSELFWSSFFPHFPTFGLNTERYSVRMRENAGKMRTRITPNTENFCAMKGLRLISNFMTSQPGFQTTVIHILPYISRCLILILMLACNNFPFRAFVIMIYWTSTEVSRNLVALLDSAVRSLDVEQINVFWTSAFDSVSIVFDSLSVSRSLLELYFSHSI